MKQQRGRRVNFDETHLQASWASFVELQVPSKTPDDTTNVALSCHSKALIRRLDVWLVRINYTYAARDCSTTNEHGIPLGPAARRRLRIIR